VRAALWIRIAFLLLSAALLVAAVQVRRDADAKGGVPEGTRLTGITGQRQAIMFAVDSAGGPQFLKTRIWAQCPGPREHRTDWAPADAAIPYSRQGEWVFVQEEKSFSYRNGARGKATVGMGAQVRSGRIDGFARAVWRFERNGREYTVCDSGQVPFAAGARAGSRLERVARVRGPVTLYPTKPERRRAHSVAQLRFVLAVDDTCTRTYLEMREAIRRARHRFGDDWRAQRAYVRAHKAQLFALVRLGEPPENQAIYRRWLGNFDKRVELEWRQFLLLRRGELDRAASLAARIATLKAGGNAAGLAFGLRPCVSNGPEGAPKS
jgi:hypothetical protein